MGNIFIERELNHKTSKHAIKAKSECTRVTEVKEEEGAIGELWGSVVMCPEERRSVEERRNGKWTSASNSQEDKDPNRVWGCTVSRHPRQPSKIPSYRAGQF